MVADPAEVHLDPAPPIEKTNRIRTRPMRGKNPDPIKTSGSEDPCPNTHYLKSREGIRKKIKDIF